MESARTFGSHTPDEDGEILSYVDAITILRHCRNDTRRETRRVLPLIVPFPSPKPVTRMEVTHEYAGDFGDTKNPHEYVLRMLELE